MNSLIEKYWHQIISVIVLPILSLMLVLTHRIFINEIIPVGFCVDLVAIICTTLLIRSFLTANWTRLWGFALSCLMFLIPYLNSHDYLMLSRSLPGEKWWSGYIGYALIFSSVLITFIISLLPKRWFENLEIADPDLYYIFQNLPEIYAQSLPFRKEVDQKEDGTPVTKSDKLIEDKLRACILKKFPNDAIYGEEFGETASQNKRTWIIDPIDGTKNFVRNIPIWATLIALEEDGKLTKSLVVAPEMNKVWFAYDKTAWTGRFYSEKNSYDINRIFSNNCTELESAFLSISSDGGWAEQANEVYQKYQHLKQKVKRVRGFGDFYSYMLLAQGSVDLATEPDLEVYDLAALIPIVEASGGVFTDKNGNSWGDGNRLNSSLAAATQQLHEEALNV